MDDHRDEPIDRPSKRPRLSFAHESAEDFPEDVDLQTARARNDMRLKSIFEGIFEKYGRDFTEVGDEIDLESGKIVVDNGHLVGMQAENDTGDRAQTWLLQTGLSAEAEDPGIMEDVYDDDSDDGGHDEHHAVTDTPEVPSTSNPHDHFFDNGFDARDDRASPRSLQHSGLAYKDPSTLRTSQPFPNTQQVDRLPQKDAGPMDPFWRVPDIDGKFSTPTWNRHSCADTTPPLPSDLLRSASPPNAGSLWAIPRRGRPRTEGKPRTTPSKRRPQPKRKHHSSPVIRDWSFANTPDDSESDDPLQECEPSPTPLTIMNIRNKRKQPIAPTHSNRESEHDMSTHMHPAAHGESSTAYNENPTQDDSKYNLQTDTTFNGSMPQSESTADASAETLRQPDSALPAESTPTRSYRAMTPDEARLIVCLRYIQGKRWKEIHTYLRSRKLPHILQWNALHWTGRRASPPPLSGPWSGAELDTLARLKDRRGLSWADIRAEFPSRLQAEIEFELLRLWVGDSVWFGDRPTESSSDMKPDQREEQGADTPASSMGRPEEPSTGIAQVSPSPSRRDFRGEWKELLDENDKVLVGSGSQEKSPSKLSAIYLDSPAPSQKRSRSPMSASTGKRVKLML